MMRRAVWLTLLLVFGTASAISAELSLDKSSAGLNEVVRIIYSFDIDEPKNVSYTVSVDGITILNDTKFLMSMSSTYDWDVGRTLAGDYSILFSVNAGTESASTSESLQIVPTASIFLAGADEIFCFSDVEEKKYRVSNTGNIPVRVTTSYSGDFRTISPLTFDLGVDEHQDVDVEILKPDTDTTATLTFTGTNGTLEDFETVNIDVIIPVVAISLDSFSSQVSGNGTVVNAIVNNSGNMDQNLTFDITTSVSLSVTEDFQHTLVVPRNQRAQYNFTIPTTDRIIRVVMYYTDSDKTRQGIERTFELTAPESILGAINSFLSNETLKGFVITIVVLVVVVVAWKTFKWKTKKK
jgi:hypothetical protein